MKNINYSRGYNEIMLNSIEQNNNFKYGIEIISENKINFKIVALQNIGNGKKRKQNVACSDTFVENKYWYNEISTMNTYNIDIMRGNNDIYLCFHSSKRGNIKINNESIINCANEIKLFNYDLFKNDKLYPTWEELVYDEINMNYSNGFDYPLIESTYDQEEIITMMKTLTTNRLTMGNNVSKFEKDFAKYVGSKYAVMVNSGSSANLLSMAVATNYFRENRLLPGDKVIVPNICWSTSVWPIIQMNLQPVFVDIDPNTMNMDIDDLKRKITSEVKGIIAVHILGNSTNMDELMKIVKENNLFLMEDTCESLGSKYRNKVLGTFGDFGTYSFYYSHHITTIEGGMVVCNKESDYELLKCLRAHGWSRYLKNKKELEEKYKDVDPRFLFVNVGYNLRPMETQASMGLVQLRKLDLKNSYRVLNHKNMSERIINDPRNKGYFTTPTASKYCCPAWFSLVFILDDNISSHYKNFLEYLTENKVENRPIVTGNFARQPIFKFLNLDIRPEEYKGAEVLHKRGFFIGLSCNKISEERIERLADIFFGYKFT